MPVARSIEVEALVRTALQRSWCGASSRWQGVDVRWPSASAAGLVAVAASMEPCLAWATG